LLLVFVAAELGGQVGDRHQNQLVAAELVTAPPAVFEYLKAEMIDWKGSLLLRIVVLDEVEPDAEDSIHEGILIVVTGQQSSVSPDPTNAKQPHDPLTPVVWPNVVTKLRSSSPVDEGVIDGVVTVVPSEQPESQCATASTS
jgi:hypothetical protein